ncbi:metal-dependent hydrolase [Chloroflexota bacterium]
MLIFGHVGITLGTAIAIPGVQNVLRFTNKGRINNQSIKNSLSFVSLVNRIDVKILLLGSLLPDIIDKPVGQWLFKEYFSNGRIFSHALLFFILITFLGIFYYRRYHKTWFLFLSLGTFMHLILDEMWRAPGTLFWPILGLEFDKMDLTGWIGGLWQSLVTNPAVYVSELVGLFIIIWFLWMLIRRRTFYSFVRYGKIQ